MSALLDGRYLARITVELETPFLVASGESSDVFDAVPIVDANGLPAIPGSTLGGILRHAFAEHFGEQRAAEIFGAPAARGETEGGHGSRLWVSWAHVHDQSDRPVDGLRLEREEPDAVLENAAAPTLRDHVRIGHRGAGEVHGKFDQAVVPAGHRFTFELVLEGAAGELAAGEKDQEAFEWLLAYLASGRARIGGSGRRGLGAFRVVRCAKRAFDLRTKDDAREFAGLPVGLDEATPQLGSPSVPGPLPEDGSWRTLTLELLAEDYWGFHGEDPWLLEGEERAPDFNPVREERIEWEHGGGAVSPPRLLAPGSGLKGPIAHRVAFHDNLLTGRFAERPEAPGDLATWAGSGSPAVRELFGSIHESSAPASKEGEERSPSPPPATAGRVFIDDLWLDRAVEGRLQRIAHNSIDRFTGGVRAGILFEERVIYRGPTLCVRLSIHGFEELSEGTRSALREALRDLAEGRLALSAGAGRGHGYFQSVKPFDEVWQDLEPGDQNKS